MIPDSPGYYWIKSLDYDGKGGKSVSDWYPASYSSGLVMETFGDDRGVKDEFIVEVGPEIIPPDED